MNARLLLLCICGCASAPSPPTAVAPAEAPPPESAPASDNALPSYVSPPDPPYVPRPQSQPASPPPNDPAPDPADVKACAARGGKIERVCMMGAFECVIRYRDAGKSCTDKSHCTGDCVYEGPHPIPARPVGKCQRTSDPCGCRAKMIAGKVQPAMCVD